MTFPLAHDDEGLPVEVPPVAAGWLVRRHAGGKGRPGAVYDGEGRPLVVELDATAADLRMIGCRPGAYRLDAVDQARRTLGVTAYTEVPAGEVEDRGEGGAGTDAAVAALARAVEAMQRVQAERERVQAAMFQKLIDRIAPAPVARPAEEMRNAVMQALDLRKEMRKAMEQERAEDEEDDDGDPNDADGDPSATLAAQIVALLHQFAPLIAARFADPRAATPGAVAPSPAPAMPREGGDESAPAAVSGQSVAGDALGDDRAKVDAAIAAVFDQLSPAEQMKAVAMLKRWPASALREIERRLISLPVEQAAAEARQMLQMLPEPPAEPEVREARRRRSP